MLFRSHNPQAAEVLAQNLGDMGFHPETFGVVGMLRDKDIAGVIRAVQGRITQWLVASLEGPRAASAQDLVRLLGEAGVKARVDAYDAPRLAYAEARRRASEDDRIVVFGSFLTVADVMAARDGA